ncbi:MAG: FtsQ-type POTRA domain-containing protein [Leucobacter sp.]|nr:FtsQ-type POTRA domain-containing protein [Leucobacter sp.]
MKRPGGFDKRAERERQPEPDAAEKRGRQPREKQETGTPPDGHGVAAPPEPATGEPVAVAKRPGVLDRLSSVGRTVRPGARTGGGAETGSGVESGGSDTAASDAGVPDADQTETAALAPAGSRGMLQLRREPREVDQVKAAEKRLRVAEQRSKRRQRRETRRFTSGARRRRRRVFIVLGTIAGLVLFVLLGTLTPIMSVRDIKIEGATTVDVEEITAALSEFDGVPLALVDENDVLRALEGFPLIQRFAVERVPPSTLVVRIEERVPTIALQEGDAFRLYDAAGVLVGEVAERPEGVPLGGEGLQVTSSKGFLAASEVVRDMPASLRAQLASVNAVSGQDVTLNLASGIEVFWGNPDETKRKSLVLETMLVSLKDRPVTHIDVSSTESPIFK